MVAAAVAMPRAAWACGQCVGEGSSSGLGWLVIGGAFILGFRILTKKK